MNTHIHTPRIIEGHDKMQKNKINEYRILHKWFTWLKDSEEMGYQRANRLEYKAEILKYLYKIYIFILNFHIFFQKMMGVC